MAYPASEIVTAARDLHPAFTKEQTPTMVLLRQLTRYSRRLRGKVFKMDRSALLSDQTISMPLADFGAGYALAGTPQYVHGGTVTLSGGDTDTFDLIDFRSRNQRAPRWAGWLEGSTLHLIGTATWWNDVTQIVLKLVLPQADITASTVQVDLDDRARDPLIAYLGDFMAARGQGQSQAPIDATRFRADFMAAEAAYLDELSARQSTKVTFTREVW